MERERCRERALYCSYTRTVVYVLIYDVCMYRIHPVTARYHSFGPLMDYVATRKCLGRLHAGLETDALICLGSYIIDGQRLSSGSDRISCLSSTADWAKERRRP